MTDKTRIDFQVAAFKLRPKRWEIRDCSICGYKCSYIFSDNAERVAYDRGCYCTNSSNIDECSWNDLANYYNLQKDEKYIRQMNQFWGFDDGIDSIKHSEPNCGSIYEDRM